MTARQPGIAFVSPASALAEALPRMDIACFTGFAARGPVHEPVAVESPEQYQRVFGSDLPLVWDAESGGGGEMLHAHLGPAVRAFFVNGGRRAWVIRVADEPRSNRFPVPGLCRVAANGRLLPAYLTAATPGSWSDPLSVASSVDQAPLILRAANLHDGRLRLDLRSSGALLDGDLLQAEWEDGRIAFLPYSGAEAIAWSDIRWFRTATLANRARDGYGRVYRVGYRHRFPLSVSTEWKGDRPVLIAQLPADRAPQPGETLKVHLGSAEYWLQVERCEPGASGTMMIAGCGLRRLALTPAAWPGQPTSVTRLRLNLHIDEDGSNAAASATRQLRELGFCDHHPNALAKLTTLASDTLVWRGSTTVNSGGIHFLPLGLTTDPGPACSAIPLVESRLTRDGLKHFGAHLFLDPALAMQRTQQLADAADRIRFTGASTRPLRGLHAAYGIEEATLLCVPDAVHRPWQRVPGNDYPTPSPSAPIPPPANVCTDGSFLPCLPHKQRAPVLAADPADAQGAVRLSWNGGPTTAQYILEEARDPDWLDPAEIYRGPATDYTLRDRPHGDYFYRLRFETAVSYSDWSAGLPIRIDPSAGWKIDEATDYRDTDLLAIQRGLIRLAAARGDCLAVLALPRHYRQHLAIDHVRRLKDETPSFFDSDDAETIDVPPLSAGEAASWSYAALYHPWLRRLDAAADGQQLPALPPDGPATGVIARRTLERGAWIAPANQTLVGFAALDAAFPANEAQLAAAINPIGKQGNSGLNFTVLDALTLSEDADTQPINVRRLISLLRRLALKQGALFVFEPNSDALRRAIDHRFRNWLGALFARGAFAGATPAEAYRLRVDSTANTPQSIDAGRLIIEIAVAPAQPMRFLTVRLVQTGEQFSVVEA